VPGLAKQTSTPASISVRIKLSAPFIIQGVRFQVSGVRFQVSGIALN
jgi:hypothetical protein